MDKVILNICKENKTHLSSLKTFQRNFLKYYEKNIIKIKKIIWNMDLINLKKYAFQVC